MVRNADLGVDPSVPKLIEFLRTAFHPRHFDDVEEVLIAREKKWKVEIGKLKEENETLRLDKVVVETELNKLKDLIVKVDNDRTAIRESKKNVNVEVTDLRKKIVELENEKITVEAAAVGWKRRFEDLEARISLLENDANLLMGLEPPVSKNVKVGLGGTIPESSNANFDSVKVEADVSDKNTCEVGAPPHHSPTAENGNSHGAGSREHPNSVVVVDISDSDDDSNVLPQNMTSVKSPEISHSNRMDAKNLSFTLQRKQDPQIEISCTYGNTQSSKRKRLHERGSDEEQMAAERTSRSYRIPFVLSDIDTESDQSVNELKSDCKKVRNWNDQIEMELAILKDPELCMDAVCALYRQELEPNGLTPSKRRGFVTSDALRGRELAKFLIDGDPQGKRGKSMNELMSHDDKGIEDCKKIASSHEHSAQLFRMYKNQDPLFP